MAAGIGAIALCAAPAGAADKPGGRPGDDAMTCRQIAAELEPYTQQMAAAFAPLGETTKQILARTRTQQAEAAGAAAAMTAGALATGADPTGAAGKGYGMAELAMQREMWERALRQNQPLDDQAKRDMGRVLDRAGPMQSNPRLQRLLQLAEEKRCQ